MAASRAQPDSALVQRPAATGDHAATVPRPVRTGRLAGAGDSGMPGRCPISKGRLPSGRNATLPCQMAGAGGSCCCAPWPIQMEPVQLAGAGPAGPVRNTRPCRLADQPRDLAPGVRPPSRDAAGRGGGCHPVPGAGRGQPGLAPAPTSPPRRATPLMCSWHSSAPLHLTPHALRPRRSVADLKPASRPALAHPVMIFGTHSAATGIRPLRAAYSRPDETSP